MSITTTTNKVQYNCDGATKEFSFAFPITGATDLKVIKKLISDGSETELTLDVDYSVTASGGNYSAGGKITTLDASALPSTYTLTIKRVLSATQETDYQEGDPFPANTHEAALDKVTMLIQQLIETFSRAIVAPESEASGITYELPSAESRANKRLAFDESGNLGVENTSDADADAAANSAVAAAASEVAAANSAADAQANADSLDADLINADIDLINADIDALENLTDSILNHILVLAVQLQSDQLNLPNGWADNFIDEDGVDTADSLNESYDSVSDFYEAVPRILDSYSESNENTSNALYSGSITYNGQAFTLASAQKITSCKFHIAKNGSPTGNIVARLYAVASGTVGVDAVPGGSELAASGNVDISTLGTSLALHEFVFSTPYDAPAGDYVVVLQYSGGDVSNNLLMGKDSTLPTHPGNQTYLLSGSWSTLSGSDVCFYILGGADNMTLISENVEALAEPTKVRLLVFADLNGNTLNTDIKGYVSNDDGANYDEVTTLAKVGDLTASIAIYAGEITPTDRADKTMRIKVTTLNSKAIQVYG